MKEESDFQGGGIIGCPRLSWVEGDGWWLGGLRMWWWMVVAVAVNCLIVT